MIYRRNTHGCTIFNSPGHGNRPVAVVAGGFNNGYIYTVEVWDFTKEDTSWIQGKIFKILIPQQKIALFFYK